MRTGSHAWETGAQWKRAHWVSGGFLGPLIQLHLKLDPRTFLLSLKPVTRVFCCLQLQL